MVWICDNVEQVMAAKDYYQLLGVSRDATDREIKKAFRALAVKYHPDKNKAKDAEDRFREIAKAYKVLSDKEKRKRYDRFGDEESSSSGFESGSGQHFNFNEFFRDFDEAFSFHQHQHQGYDDNRRHNHNHNENHNGNHYNNHFRAHRQSHGHQFGFNFDDLFDGMENEEFGSFGDFFGHHSDDTFGDGNSFFGGNHFNGMRMNSFSSNSRHDERCRTVTKRTGNSVMTYTECS